VIQTGGGRVTGLRAKRKGTPVTYEADLVIGGAGSLSLLQDKADFEGPPSTPTSGTRSSARRTADRRGAGAGRWDDALVFKATDRAAGYLWYFREPPPDQRRTRLPDERGADAARRGR